MADTSSIEHTLGEMSQWQVDHQQDDDLAFKKVHARLDVIESNMGLLPTKDDIKEVVREALLETLFTTGKWTKIGLITAATVIGSVAVIGGGLKWLLGLIGFTYIK